MWRLSALTIRSFEHTATHRSLRISNTDGVATTARITGGICHRSTSTARYPCVGQGLAVFQKTACQFAVVVNLILTLPTIGN